MTTGTSHGILDPRSGEAHFTLERRPPSAALEPFVETYWIARWNLQPGTPFAQETLPHPNIHLVFGTHRPGVHGVGTKRFVAELAGDGFVVGVKFRPGGFSPFFERDAAELRGREVPLGDLFGLGGVALDGDVLAAATDAERIERIERFLLSREPATDELTQLAARAVDVARADASVTRVADLAARVGVTGRTLERVFRRHVGIGPKWVIRRFRVHEACERIVRGAAPSWPELALELGYFDQAHFIRDFKSQVGRTPAEYAALCAAPST